MSETKAEKAAPNEHEVILDRLKSQLEALKTANKAAMDAAVAKLKNEHDHAEAELKAKIDAHTGSAPKPDKK